MTRFILRLRGGVQSQAVVQQVMQVRGVTDAVAARSTNAVTAVVPDDRADEMRERLADLEFVDAVFEDIQGVPQVADEGLRRDFFRKLREERDTEEPPSTLEGEPTRRPTTDADDGADDDSLRTDGGLTLPRLTDEDQHPDTLAGPIANADDSVAFAGAGDLHGDGTTGSSVIAVNVDTGVCAEQFAASRRLAGADLTSGDDPYVDSLGHGSMTMGIMAGGPETEGVKRGFAPGADIYPIKSTLAASELIQAQDIVMQVADNTGRPVVVNNSIGFLQCEGLCDHPVTDAVRTASRHAGVTQIWAAGNQAGDCGQDCSNTGISGPNSTDAVLTVGATGKDGDPATLQSYSSRGGEEASCGTRKPEVTAPIFGTMPWECGSQDLGNGGGTSGACPQVAGTVALMVDNLGESARVEATARALADTADQFRGSGWNGCSGHGNVQAAAAAAALEDVVVIGPVDRGSLGVAAAGLVGALGPVAAVRSQNRGS